MLSQHPDVLRRLREEILNKVGNSRRPNYDDMRDMKYMRAVINGEHAKATFFIVVTGILRNTSTLPACVNTEFNCSLVSTDYIPVIHLGHLTSGKFSLVHACVTMLIITGMDRTSTEPTVWPGINGGKPIYIPPNTR